MKWPPLVMVEWTDTTNIAAWCDLDEVKEFAENGAWVCRNVGFLVNEDDECVVLAARAAPSATPPQVGLFERIPKRAITRRWPLSKVQAEPSD